jgi:hypothetical protein
MGLRTRNPGVRWSSVWIRKILPVSRRHRTPEPERSLSFHPLNEEPTMNTITSLLIPFAVATLAATSAVAGVNGEATPDYPTSITSTVQRGDVAAQGGIARARGTTADGEIGARVVEASQPGLTRAQVKGELAVAQRLGLTAIGELSVEPTVAQSQALRQGGQRDQSSQIAAR